MSRYKQGAQAVIETLLEDATSASNKIGTMIFVGMGVVSALLFIGEVLEKHLKEIATNTKRIGNQ